MGTYEIEYISIDKAGNKSRVVRIVKVVDTTSPTITGVTGNPTSWTTSATLVVNATDNVGIKEYSFDNGTTWQTGNRESNKVCCCCCFGINGIADVHRGAAAVFLEPAICVERGIDTLYGNVGRIFRRSGCL